MRHVGEVVLVLGMALVVCGLIGCGPEMEDDESAVVPARASSQDSVIVDLTKFFNNKAFEAQADQTGGFDGWGNAYIAEKMPRTRGGRRVYVDGGTRVTFAVAGPKAAGANNISANGETIEVKPGSYSTLYVVGSATGGNAQVDLSIEYDSGGKTARLKLTDWCGEAAFGEAVYAEFDQRMTPAEPESKACRIWIQKIPLDGTSELKSITLPTNRDVHIFAMTLIYQ